MNSAFFTALDGLKLYVRDYASGNARDDLRIDLSADKHQAVTYPVLCLHGLTRSGDDFEPMITAIEGGSASNYRFVVPDLRGRGHSEYDQDPSNYHPLQYVEDCWAILDSLNISEFALIGTSLGGIVAMHMYEQQPERIRGIALNDIGPTLPTQAMNHIVGYLGSGMEVQDWSAADTQIRARLQTEYPNFSDQQWLDLTKRSYEESSSGRIVLRYDENIRIPLEAAIETGDQLDLWAIFAKITESPLLCLRGDQSQVLPMELAEQMQKHNSHCTFTTIPARGHVPILDEPESLEAIQTWLKACNK